MVRKLQYIAIFPKSNCLNLWFYYIHGPTSWRRCRPEPDDEWITLWNSDNFGLPKVRDTIDDSLYKMWANDMTENSRINLEISINSRKSDDTINCVQGRSPYFFQSIWFGTPTHRIQRCCGIWRNSESQY